VSTSYLIINRETKTKPKQPHAIAYHLEKYQNSHTLFREVEPLGGRGECSLSVSFNTISRISHFIPWLVDHTFLHSFVSPLNSD